MIYEDQDPEEAQKIIQSYDQQISEADGWIPNEYVSSREQALNTISSEEKIGIIEGLITQYEEISGIAPFTYILKDPSAREPNGVMVFDK